MRQAGLKLKIYMGKVDVVDNGNLAGRMLRLILMTFGALALAYALILGNMVFDIVERRALEKEALALSNEVGNLELSYLHLSNKVDLELSHSLGFRETKPAYATRKSLSFAPSGNVKLDDEI